METHQMKEAVAEANRARQFAEKRLEQYSAEVNDLKALLGIKVKSAGAISIDFDQFVKGIGPENEQALRNVLREPAAVPVQKKRLVVTADTRHVD
jgi:predicted flap endonuclease-1-like 5' DNA nuclease